MTILITNIGTSDLAVKINGLDYYVPIFERDEPNEEKSSLTPEQLEVWEQRNKYIAEGVCRELNVAVTEKDNKGKKYFDFSFRELTDKLRSAYQQNPDFWHSRICPSRIGGAIAEAKNQFAVQQVYIFVTNQKPPHKDDTIYLFDILKDWFQREIPDINLICEQIPAEIPANDQDKLLDYFYDFFQQNISYDSTLLVNIKGGTPQMQTALRMQAISYPTRHLMFIDPQFSIGQTFAGKFSTCKLNPYWRYMRVQKYQTVQQLLERWDFEAAKQILNQWLETLEYFSKFDILDIAESKKTIEVVIQALEIAICYFNLDDVGARKIIISNSLDSFKQFATNYDKLLNLYTQCRIYWELNEVANFLSRMSSFCEETLHHLIDKLGGLKYFDRVNYPNDWYLDKGRVEAKLWRYFAENEEQDNEKFKNWDFQRKPKYRLPGRFSKWNFVDAMISFRDRPKEIRSWEAISNSLNLLDYWVDKRNELIHSASGVSKQSMVEFLAKDRENDEELTACDRDNILTEITNIGRQTSQLLNQAKSPYIGLDSKVKYYIYSDVKEWAIERLKKDGLQ